LITWGFAKEKISRGGKKGFLLSNPVREGIRKEKKEKEVSGKKRKEKKVTIPKQRLSGKGTQCAERGGGKRNRPILSDVKIKEGCPQESAQGPPSKKTRPCRQSKRKKREEFRRKKEGSLKEKKKRS